MFNPRILLTGHTGFIGCQLAAKLNEVGSDWFGVSSSAGYELELIECLDDIPPCDLVVHLASLTDVAESWKKPALFLQTNYLTTLTVLEFARKHAASVLFFSSYMYGRPKTLPIDESHPVSIENPYAASKYTGEELCRFYADTFNVPVSILRLFNVFGIGQPEHALIAHILNQARFTNEIRVKDLAPKRDYLYLEDLINAVLKFIPRPPETFEIYNLGAGYSHSVQEVIDTVGAVLGTNLRVNCAEEPRPNEIGDCIADSTKFSAKYDWQPTHSLRDGLEKIIVTSM